MMFTADDRLDAVVRWRATRHPQLMPLPGRLRHTTASSSSSDCDRQRTYDAVVQAASLTVDAVS